MFLSDKSALQIEAVELGLGLCAAPDLDQAFGQVYRIVNAAIHTHAASQRYGGVSHMWLRVSAAGAGRLYVVRNRGCAANGVAGQIRPLATFSETRKGCRCGSRRSMTQSLKQQFDELMIHWQSTLGDKITADDFQHFISCWVMMLVTDSLFTMLRTGMTREQVNTHLADVLMPNMRRVQRDAMAMFHAALHGDPAAPSLTLQ